MREDQRFEIERAYDLLPHVVGASWACVFFRLNKTKPTRQEFREKVVEYLNFLEGLGNSYPDGERFLPIRDYLKNRHKEEVEKILAGKNQEIEKRYARFVDYG
jgi:hypothetical protein